MKNVLLWLLIIIVLLFCSVMLLDWRMLDWSFHGVGDFFLAFFPLDFSRDFLITVLNDASQTLAMALLATGLSALCAALLATAANHGARWAYLLMFNVLRTVPELLFASILVLMVGLGPTAGVLALTLHTTGVLARLFLSSLQNCSQDAKNALLFSGASSAQSFCFGLLPMVQTQWFAYSLYRSEMNIRAAAVLGLVGAGGLGQQLYVSLSLFQYQKAGTLIVATMLLVMLAETVSRHLRRNRFSTAQVD